MMMNGVPRVLVGNARSTYDPSSGLDNHSVVRADVVTADGRLITVSAAQYLDLFWALRGGGGNFGVVTSLEFR